MKITVCAVGRLRKGPEAALVDDYLDRFGKTGRSLGLGPARVVEVEDRKGGGQAAEARLLEAAIPERACIVALDERGQALSSTDLADRLANWRDDGVAETAFVIGGADGLTDGLRARADILLSFGPMVWPHMLARVMLAEQLYRSATILAGGPYHRA